MTKDLTKAGLDNLEAGREAARSVRWAYERAGFHPATERRDVLGAEIPRRRQDLEFYHRPLSGNRAEDRARDRPQGPSPRLPLGAILQRRSKPLEPQRGHQLEDLVEVVAERFIARHIRANLKAGGSAHETERLMRKEIIEPWRGRRMSDITKRDVNKLLDDILYLARGTPPIAR